MAESEKMDSQKPQRSQEDDESFVWDEKTQLYFHASSGFYHDPYAGWYYSSGDGLYYRYENGEYLLLESDKGEECRMNPCGGSVCGDSSRDESCSNVFYGCNENSVLSREDGDFRPAKAVYKQNSSGEAECSNDGEPENPPPPSEWLEDTLIDLYLSGYKQPANTAGGAGMSSEADDLCIPEIPANGDDDEELEEGEWIPEDDFDFASLYEKEADMGFHQHKPEDEGYSKDEENWQAQYGQVIQSPEEPMLDIPAVDLWDWTVVAESRKDGGGQVARLVGRLLKLSAKLHPSMPSGGTLLKTAPICEARLHLVRVTTGQVYKLKSPSTKYVASLSMYDSSNPTKDWGFPDISVTWQKPTQKSKSKKAVKKSGAKELASLQDKLCAPSKPASHSYRDRAAERRNLHGGFGVGPGQKNVALDDDDERSSPVASTEEAAAQALDMSFGSASYARRILGNMGWKEGEALGKTMKGSIEPIQAVGNVGSAGLGYPRGRTK